ncbi:MAG: ATP-binding protein [Candidatus Kapaibacterium sp.]
MTQTYSISLPADTRILAELRSFIVRNAATVGVDDSTLHALELAADEIATNVIEHVTTEMPVDIFCKCSIDTERHLVTCEISWPSTEPFRPDVLPETHHIKQRLESRQPGGLGIFLIHSLVDEIEYDYHDGRSLIRLVKKLQWE